MLARLGILRTMTICIAIPGVHFHIVGVGDEAFR